MVDHELIRMLDFNAVGLQNSLWKIFDVECDDRVSVAHDGGGYNVSVIGVW